MYRPLSIFIGLRYTRAKRRNHFISFISLTSILGIALGITALITVLSVMNGFQTEIRQRILGMTAHATVTQLNGRLADWSGLENRLVGEDHILAAAPYVRQEAMVVNGRAVSGAIVSGILPKQEDKVSDVGRHMLDGSLNALDKNDWGIVLGDELARSLGVGMGDKVMVITPEAGVTPAGILPRLRRFTVVGIFRVGMYEYDRGSAFISIKDAQRLFRMGKDVSGLRLKLDDMFLAPMVSNRLSSQLGHSYWVRDWTQMHVNYFKALRTEKLVMFVILFLVVAVAAFNIVSTLVMVVTDKQADIAILRTLGLTPRQVMGVFMVQGTFIGVIGTALGVIGGVLLALNVPTIVPAIERLFHTQFLPASVYYISEIPSRLEINDVWHIAVIAFVLSIVSTLYPALRASRTQPAEALRYE
ncbi:MAG: lipoprotein-releasing ABC transporter permease subunit [Gammaproteobacteria bacterium]